MNEEKKGAFSDFVGADPSPAELVSSAPAPKPNRTTLKTVILTVVGIIVVCLCLGAGFALVGSRTAQREEGPVTEVINAFMRDMAAKDIDTAYALFSPRAQRQMSREKLGKAVVGKNYALFDGYEDVTIQKLVISKTANTNQDLPQGTVAQVSGIVRYAGDIDGQFVAVLEKVGGRWMLFSINVTAPPDKF